MADKRGATQREYNPGHMLDMLVSRMNLAGDLGLSRKLNIARSAIERMRRNELPVDATMLVLMHEASGIQTAELRMLMGDRRKAFRISYHYSHKKPKLTLANANAMQLETPAISGRRLLGKIQKKPAVAPQLTPSLLSSRTKADSRDLFEAE